jgi:hypothetical protein
MPVTAEENLEVWAAVWACMALSVLLSFRSPQEYRCGRSATIQVLD